MDVLIVEDDHAICDLLHTLLSAEGYEVRLTYNGLSGLKQAQQKIPEVIILDWMLPGLNGLEVCQRVRALPQGNEPYILMLTARGEEMDKVVGLSTGADDYLVKPFSSRELIARLRALTRRSQRGNSKSHLLRTRHFNLDLESRTALRMDQVLNLTTLEFDLLATLVGQLNRVWTRDQLISRLWGDDFYGDERVVDTHVARLRKKTEDNPAQPQFLQTVTGVGYRFVDEPA